MEECKRLVVTACEALVDFMPKRVKAVVGDNGGGKTKYRHVGSILTFHLSLDIHCCVFSYF